MSDPAFTGERLHRGDARFTLDLARHEAAYRIAAERSTEGQLLDLGSGSGYGAHGLAAAHRFVVGFDRAVPDAANRGAARFVRGDLSALPFPVNAFARVLSFQVIEHLEDPTDYLDGIARVLRPDGEAIVTTPNILMSDGVNPYHVHEYRAEELAELLRTRFADVDVQGVGASPKVRAALATRSARIRRIMRLDPLGLHRRLPDPLVEWAFARLAVLVRRLGGAGEAAPDVDWRDFPVGPAADDCLDLLAFCRRPR